MSGPRDPEADARRNPEYDPDWPGRDLEPARDRDWSSPGWEAEPEGSLSDPWTESWDRETWTPEARAVPAAPPDEAPAWESEPEPAVGDPWSEAWDADSAPAPEAPAWGAAVEPAPSPAVEPAPPPAVEPGAPLAAGPPPPVAQPDTGEPDRPVEPEPEAPPEVQPQDVDRPWWLEPVPATEPEFESAPLPEPPASAPADEPPPFAESELVPPPEELAAEPVPDEPAAAEPPAMYVPPDLYPPDLVGPIDWQPMVPAPTAAPVEPPAEAVSEPVAPPEPEPPPAPEASIELRVAREPAEAAAEPAEPATEPADLAEQAAASAAREPAAESDDGVSWLWPTAEEAEAAAIADEASQEVEPAIEEEEPTTAVDVDAAEEPATAAEAVPPPPWEDDLAAWRTDADDMELWPAADLAGAAILAEPEPEAVPVESAAPPVVSPPEERQPDVEPASVEQEPAPAAPATGAAGVPDQAEAQPPALVRGRLAPVTGRIITRRARPDAAEQPQEEPATGAEAAVPWLIGIVLLLAGMVIVLLALIFAGEESLGLSPSATIVPSASPGQATAGGNPDATATQRPTPSAEPTATAAPAPEYGQLEMVYLGRAAALEPIYLLHHDFTLEQDAAVLAQDPDRDVRRFAWAPDGTVGAALLLDRAVSIELGQKKRSLGDGIASLTFGSDGELVYGVRITQDGTNDVAAVVAIDYLSGEETNLASISYARPQLTAEDAAREAQFQDDGGEARLFWMDSEVLRLWVLGAGAWEVDPASGDVTQLEPDALPVLWDPPGRQRVVINEEGTDTTLVVYRSSGTEVARATVNGLVSHLRWSPDARQVVFTVGTTMPEGGVRQELWLWQFADDSEPMAITDTGANFGAEWRGTTPNWTD